jgi:flagellar hook-length control protein FliK
MSPPAPDPAALEGESTPHAGAPASPLGRAAPEQPTALDARGAAEQSGVPSLELLHEAPQPADDFLSARHSPAILQTAPAIEPPVGLAPQSPESAAAEGPTLSEVEVPALPAQQQSLDAHAEAFEGHTSPDHFAPSQQALDRELPAELTIGAGGPIAAGEPPSVERTPAAALEANAPASSPTAGKDLHAPQKLASPGAVIRQLASAVHQSVQDGARELIVRLDPPSLGTVHLLVHQHENAVNAVIQVAAGEIRDLVTQNMSGLREALQQAGVEVGQCHVELGAGGGHRHADGDSAGRPPAHSPFRGRVERTGRGDAVTVTPYHGSLSPSLGLNYVA